MDKTSFIIEAKDAGKRVDRFLAEKMPEHSRSLIQKMEKNFDNAHRLKIGEMVEVRIRNLECVSIHCKTGESGLSWQTGTRPKFPIIYEDDDIIVIDKPRGMVMYPAVGNTTGTLVQELSEYCHLSTLGGDIRPGVVHRIDKDTSGIVILAKSDIAFRELTKVFSEHRLVRKYIAFVWGIPTWTAADIEGNIARNSRNRQKMSMVKVGGKTAKTLAEVINVWPNVGISEMRCTLFTGRTHQIRVHLSAHGFPVVTDPTYGRGRESKIKPGELLSFLRNHTGQCLHAEILELNHPVTGDKMKFQAKLPPDLTELKQLTVNN